MNGSTGPRTQRGKTRSSQNAAKHWVESRRILPEEREEAAILRSGVEEDLKPEGLIEHEIIDDLTLNRLLRRRIDMAFTREFSRATIEKKIEVEKNNLRPVTRYWLREAELLHGHSAEPAQRLDPGNCIKELQRLKERVGDRGPDEEDLTFIRKIYGDEPTHGGALLMLMLTEFGDIKTEKDEAVAAIRRKDLHEGILDALQAEIENEKFRQKLAWNLLAIEVSSDFQEPARHELETLLRYRAANTREFNSLLDSLERIRRLRQNAV